jgi:hypothetical protein
MLLNAKEVACSDDMIGGLLAAWVARQNVARPGCREPPGSAHEAVVTNDGPGPLRELGIVTRAHGPGSRPAWYRSSAQNLRRSRRSPGPGLSRLHGSEPPRFELPGVAGQAGTTAIASISTRKSGWARPLTTAAVMTGGLGWLPHTRWNAA